MIRLQKEKKRNEMCTQNVYYILLLRHYSYIFITEKGSMSIENLHVYESFPRSRNFSMFVNIFRD